MVSAGLACLLLCNRYAALAGIGGGSFLINLGLSSDQYHHINLQNIQMPEMDGYEATRMIRKHPPWQHIPILAMAANAMDNDIRKCKACGMQGHIAKPIHEEKMLTSILQHTQGSAE